MKNNIKKILAIMILVLGPVLMTFAQPPAPAMGPSGTPITCNPLGGVPVGNGYWILLALAFSYGVYKIWQMRKAEKTA